MAFGLVNAMSAGDSKLEMEGEVQRKRDDAELKTRGWTQPEAWSPAAQEAEEAEREAERRASEPHRRS